MLTKCCCCSLRTGSLIIAWLGIIFGTLEFIGFIFCAIFSSEIAEKMTSENNMGLEGKLDQEEGREFLSKVLLYVGLFGVVACIFVLIIYGLMIYGIDKNRPGFVMPYLIISGFGLAIYGLGALFQLIQFLIGGYFAQFFGQLIASAIGFAIAGYLWMVVYSLYKSMRETSYGQEPIRVEYGISKR